MDKTPLLCLSTFFLLESYSISLAQVSNTLPELIWETDFDIDYKKNQPEIYYSPHQDDETIGMGASISKNSRSGKPVFVVLFANGAGSAAHEILNGEIECGYHKTFHSFNLSRKEFIDARNREFIAACKSLGAARIYIANNGKAWDESIGYDDLTIRFEELIVYFENKFPQATHNLISGNCDTSSGKQEAHHAGATAINSLYKNKIISNVNLFKVYIYYYPIEQRIAQSITTVNPIDIFIRQRASNEYNLFKPEIGRFAIGYQHSVWPLFNELYSSSFEYIDHPKNDCD
jgi:hypothetical protein